MMLASSIGARSSSPSLANEKDQMSRLRSVNKLISTFRLAIAASCFVICIGFVPEQPTELASICERHNSVIACQVW